MPLRTVPRDVKVCWIVVVDVNLSEVFDKQLVERRCEDVEALPRGDTEAILVLQQPRRQWCVHALEELEGQLPVRLVEVEVEQPHFAQAGLAAARRVAVAHTLPVLSERLLKQVRSELLPDLLEAPRAWAKVRSRSEVVAHLYDLFTLVVEAVSGSVVERLESSALVVASLL